MEADQSAGSEFVLGVLEVSVPSLIINSFDLVLAVLAAAFMIVGTAWLLRGNSPGSRWIALGLAVWVVGTLVYLAYLMLAADEENALLDDLFSLFVSVGMATAGYGYLRLCAFLKGAAGSPAPASQSAP